MAKTKDEFLLGQIQEWWDCLGDNLLDGIHPNDVEDVKRLYPGTNFDYELQDAIEKDAKELFGRLKELLKQNDE